VATWPDCAEDAAMRSWWLLVKGGKAPHATDANGMHDARPTCLHLVSHTISDYPLNSRELFLKMNPPTYSSTHDLYLSLRHFLLFSLPLYIHTPASAETPFLHRYLRP